MSGESRGKGQLLEQRVMGSATHGKRFCVELTREKVSMTSFELVLSCLTQKLEFGLSELLTQLQIS